MEFGWGLGCLAELGHVDFGHLEGLAELGVVGVHGVLLGQLTGGVGEAVAGEV